MTRTKAKATAKKDFQAVIAEVGKLTEKLFDEKYEAFLKSISKLGTKRQEVLIHDYKMAMTDEVAKSIGQNVLDAMNMKLDMK